jgi:RsiW-degrading membrane proteinase PrsW (M82 family)
MNKLIDTIFICSSVIFNISVSALYIATKLDDMLLTQVFGGIAVSLIMPFTITLLGYLRGKAKKRTIISNGIIIAYLILEILLDYVLRIPFREILAIHVPYIVVFYAALFSMIAVSFEKNKKMGYSVIVTFLILMACLAFYLSPF